MLKSLKAFTLAETLIVIGVIGIVSALTLPNLNSSTGDKERIAKVKKIYQNLNDAYGRAEAVYGPYGEWFINDGNDETAKVKRAGERITEFMKVQKDCGMAVNQGCSSSTADEKPYNYKAILADGIAIVFDGSSIIIDIDGPTKGSGTVGKDYFYFEPNTEKGIIPNGYDETFANLLTSVKLGATRNMAATWIIKYDNADYLKLDSNGKCPNGTTPTEANPRCK